MTPTGAQPPLFVDLDGTLVGTDLLVESAVGLLKRHPLQALRMPLWLLRGKACLKHRIAERVAVDPQALPYHAGLVDYLQEQRAAGRALYLATASNARYAQAVAGHLGMFDGVIASDTERNLSGHRKLEAIEACCQDGFAYAGNDRVDEPIWARAQAAILVNTPTAVAQRVAARTPVERTFPTAGADLRLWLRALRAHQWLKNLLVFLPLLPIATLLTPSMAVRAVLAFVAFSLCASGVYLLNDLADLDVDRAHPRKRERPFAAGRLPVLHGLLLAPLLLVAAFAVAACAGWPFAGVLGLYWVSTTAYTFWLKRYALIDVITLAGLYTLRVLGGAAAIAVMPSFWMLAFSMFTFFSLALAKRYAELHAMRALDRTGARGRGYQVNDLPTVQLMGLSSGYLAVMVVALYLNSPEIIARYTHVKFLWGICPLLLLWVSRVWLKAARGEMADDPLVFAVRDRMSRFVLGAAVAVLLAALA